MIRNESHLLNPKLKHDQLLPSHCVLARRALPQPPWDCKGFRAPGSFGDCIQRDDAAGSGSRAPKAQALVAVHSKWQKLVLDHGQGAGALRAPQRAHA